MDRQHTDREYESELTALREKVLMMSATVEEVLAGAMSALKSRNVQKAREISALDSKIDQLELDIDNACLSILARRQPVAKDLRFITTALKVVTDLERIGDLSSNVCDRVAELGADFPAAGHAEIQRMGAIAQEMLRDALDAFVQRDYHRAESVRERDSRVDEIYAQLFPITIQSMSGDPGRCDSALRVLSIAKYIERIADHATNLSEMVIFMIRGHDVRHPNSNGRTTSRTPK